MASEKKIILDLQKELSEIKRKHAEQWSAICPQLPDEMRNRARAVWTAALHAHLFSEPGQPGPSSIIAAALLDAEKHGPRRLKGGTIDPVAFIAERIETIARNNGRHPMELFEAIEKRLSPNHVGPDPGGNEEEDEEDYGGPEE